MNVYQRTHAPTHTHTHIHTHTHTHAHSHARTHTTTPIHAHTHTHTLHANTHTLSLRVTHPSTHTHQWEPNLMDTRHIVTKQHTYSLTYTHTHNHKLTHTNTHTHEQEPDLIDTPQMTKQNARDHLLSSLALRSSHALPLSPHPNSNPSNPPPSSTLSHTHAHVQHLQSLQGLTLGVQNDTMTAGEVDSFIDALYAISNGCFLLPIPGVYRGDGGGEGSGLQEGYVWLEAAWLAASGRHIAAVCPALGVCVCVCVF